MKHPFNIAIAILLMVSQAYAQPIDTLELKFQGSRITICSKSIFEVPEKFKSTDGDYWIDSMTIFSEDQEEILSMAPRPNCHFTWYYRNDSVFFHSNMLLPIKSARFGPPDGRGFGEGPTTVEMYSFSVVDKKVGFKKSLAIEGYDMPTDSLLKIKEIYNKERLKVKYLGEERWEEFERINKVDMGWSTDFFYWCKLVAEWNEDKEFADLIDEDFRKYGEHFISYNHHDLLMENINTVLRLKDK